MARNVSALRCRCAMRIGTTRAQLRNFPGESLKPETGWRSAVISNSQATFGDGQIRRKLQPKLPAKGLAVRGESSNVCGYPEKERVT